MFPKIKFLLFSLFLVSSVAQINSCGNLFFSPAELDNLILNKVYSTIICCHVPDYEPNLDNSRSITAKIANKEEKTVKEDNGNSNASSNVNGADTSKERVANNWGKLIKLIKQKIN